MKINYVQHIAVNAKDIDASVAFYRDILGFREQKRVTMGDNDLVYLSINENSEMELFSQRNGTTPNTTEETDAGLRHIAFDVDDLDAWDAYLKEKKVPFTLDPLDMPELGKRGLLILDPDGTVVELCCDL